MNTTTRRSARYYAQQIAGSQQASAQFMALARHADAIGGNGPSPMYDEAVRLRTIASEYDQDVDDMIEQAIIDGYTPDDIENA